MKTFLVLLMCVLGVASFRSYYDVPQPFNGPVSLIIALAAYGVSLVLSYRIVHDS